MCKRISSVLVLSLLAASLVFPGTAARASDDLSVVTSTEYAAPPEAIIGEPPLADDSAGSDEAAIPQENGEQNEAGEDGFSALADTDHSIVNVLADNGGDYATRRDAVIAKYAYLLNNRWTGSHFTAVPSTVAPYSAGSLASGYQQDALRTLNYARFLAGLPDDVTLDATYTNYEQHGTVVMAANNYLTHSPVKPAGMDQDFYETGYYGTSRGNIAMGYGNLPNAVITGWMEDADNGNITMVGHRRWILNPNMAKTGFGEAGRYFAMYAFDNTRSTAVDYEAIAYPSGAAFPSNVFGSYYPWSITLNLAYYNAPVASQITVTIKHGATTWTLNSNDSSSLNSSVAFTDSEYFNVNNQGYGVANCIIFRPKPSAVGTYSGEYTVTVTGIKQKNGAAASMTYTVNFFSMAPSITSASLSDARVNQSYSQQLNASGLTPITWSLVSGALPAGLNLNSAGQISGTPTAAGSFTFTVKATNSVGDATKAFTISVLDKPTITTTSIASSTVGVPFSRTLTATGTSPITWSLYSGAIPPELSLSDSGTLSGTPTSTGSYTMTVKAANSVGSTTATFTVVVVAPVSLDGKVFTLSTALNPARKVDITGKSVANGAQAIIWDTTIGANQRFKMEEASDYPGFYFIKSVNSGKVLDIYGGKIADGSNIIQWEQKAAGYENQLWAMEPLPDGNYR
ncbi:MAG: RICIN domain-containing protein, partial [Coriobacteriales bacterium]|nr:RICIN domain-containing protein [Coriobacteriales bacterium]